MILHERLLDKTTVPTIDELIAHCGKTADLFIRLNDWLTEIYGTAKSVVFPYGSNYGWGVAHRKKQKLICNIFAELDAFTVMIRMSNNQFDSIYNTVSAYTQGYIDNKYPCGDGGWIHFRVTSIEHFEDMKSLLKVKCDK